VRRFLVAAVVYAVANAAAILFAAVVLGPGFEIGFAGFFLAVLIFTVVQALARPLLERLAAKQVPQLMGGVALVTVFLGLWVTDMATTDMSIDGLSNWLAATFIVWLVSVIVEILLPMVVPSLRAPAPKA
jgi:uncharacterized membrane protein YvlD (DUF360 family)